MKLKWTLPVLLVTLTAAAQMPSAMDQFMQVMETSMTKMDKGMAGAPGSRPGGATKNPSTSSFSYEALT
jgi:hypothetical protein